MLTLIHLTTDGCALGSLHVAEFSKGLVVEFPVIFATYYKNNIYYNLIIIIK